MARRERLTQAERRTRTREALLDAAAELFAERGITATSVEAIAEEAGYTSGAVYDHFGSKEGILIALVERGLATDPLRLQLAEVFAAPGPLLQQLHRLGRVAERNVATSPEENALWLEVQSYAMRSPEVRARLAQPVEQRLRQLGDAIPLTGALTGTDVVVLGQALLDGLKHRAMINPELVRPELWEEALALLAGIPELARLAEGNSPADAARDSKQAT